MERALIASVLCLAGTALCQTPSDPPAAPQAPRTLAVQQDGDTVTVAAPRFDATFAAADVTLATRAVHETGTDATLQLRFVGASRTGAALAADATATPSCDGDTVRFAHGNIVETYALGAGGIEQSFVIAGKPAGSGDLVLAIDVHGNVTAAAAPARHQPLEFRRDGVRAIRYGEALAFDRRGERVDVATAYDGVGRIELIVPAAFVDGARYPLVVDPAIGPVLNPGGPGWNDSAPDVAHDLEAGHFLVVWQRTFASSIGIRCQLYDEDGTAVGQVRAIADGAGYGTPAVAFNERTDPDSFFVVWSQPFGIWGRAVDADTGALLAPAFLVSNPSPGEIDANPTVAGDGKGDFVRSWVAWDRVAIGGTEPSSIKMREVFWLSPTNPSSIFLGVERTAESVGSGYVRRPRFAKCDTIRLGSPHGWINRLVWERFYTAPAPGDTDIRTMSFFYSFAGSGYTIVQAATGVPGGADIGANEILPSIAALGNENLQSDHYLIAWEDEGDVLAHRYDDMGPVGSPITVRATSNFEGQPAVGGGHCEFTVAYLRVVPPNEFDVDVFAARVLRDGTVAIADRLVDDPGPQFQNGLAASSIPSIDSVQKQSNRTLLAWSGQTGPAGSGLNDVRARFFEPIAPNANPFGTGCPGPGGEIAVIGSDNGPAFAGNRDFQLTITSAIPNSLAVLVVGAGLISSAIPGAPGCTLYAGAPFIAFLPTVTDGAGNGAVALPIPCSIPNGPVLAFQWGILAPTVNPFGWVVSNDLDITWQH